MTASTCSPGARAAAGNAKRASPVVIAFPELYTALQQGTADGWEAPVGNMYDSKFYEIAKHLSVVNWTFNCNELLINDELWQKMTPETQKIVKDTWKEVATETSNKLADDGFWDPAHGRLGAFFTPDAGYVDDPRLAAANLMAAAQRHGARLLTHREVTAIHRTDDRVTGVELDGVDRLDTPVVVNAAGPLSGAFNKLAGIDGDFTVGVRPLRQEVHHVRHGADVPVVADLDLGIYTRPTPGGGLLVGGTEPACDPLQWLENPDDAGSDPTSDVFAAQVTRAARRLPALAVPNRPNGIVGVYDVADDWTPIYDRTALDGCYVAIGTSGNQFKNAPAVGRLMAQLIDSPDTSEYVGEHTGLRIELSAFSRRRHVNDASTHTVLG